MNQPGRPRLMADEEQRRAVCALVSLGAGVDAAARHVGCSTWTIRREAQRDETFARQLQEAETAAALMPLRMIRRAAENHWRAAAWLLERMCPERFAPRRPDAVAPGELKALLDKTAAILADECYDEAQRTRVVERLRQLQEDHFGERRARQQGPPEPPSEIQQLLERLPFAGFGAEFCSAEPSFAGKMAPLDLSTAAPNCLAGKE
ncbi:MAG: hypothetical protein KF847_20140 [Pirellulales bacterium]|nr:hypothetical protein [Pirellulales bacterium]